VSLEERECNAMFNGNVVDSDSCDYYSDGVADCSQVDLATDSELSTVDTVDNVACDSLTAVQTDVTADSFRAEQLSDDTLKQCCAKAEHGKGGFTVHMGLLYHAEKIDCVGEKCLQLCLPASRCSSVRKLAHCTVGCHQAYRRTRDRIRLSFYWPSSAADVKAYCSQCEACQRAARVTVWDRTPISAVPRAQYAFQQVYADSAGPIFANQKNVFVQLFYCTLRFSNFVSVRLSIKSANG